jgi:hypothetical protein
VAKFHFSQTTENKYSRPNWIHYRGFANKFLHDSGVCYRAHSASERSISVDNYSRSCSAVLSRISECVEICLPDVRLFLMNKGFAFRIIWVVSKSSKQGFVLKGSCAHSVMWNDIGTAIVSYFLVFDIKCGEMELSMKPHFPLLLKMLHSAVFFCLRPI